MVEAGHRTVEATWNDLHDRPIKMEEIKTMVHRGAGNKAPSRDGICMTSFDMKWDTTEDEILVFFNQIILTVK
jgi:hypothetical protein